MEAIFIFKLFNKKCHTLLVLFGLMALASCGSDPNDKIHGVAIGPGCPSSAQADMCISLRYVSYVTASGAPTLSAQEVVDNVTAANDLWSSCRIAFTIGEYVSFKSSDFGLNIRPQLQSELGSIRQTLDQDDKLLVVSTDTWDGALAGSGADAWTQMPGTGPFGTIINYKARKNAGLLAHEIGHYLGLDHSNVTSNLMSPTVYVTSTQITQAQCDYARKTANAVWSAMLR